MHGAMRIPEVSQRDRFVRRALTQRCVFAVDGDDGLACVACSGNPGVDVTLLWSNECEAQRWADVLASNPRVRKLPLDELLSDVLPKLSELNRLVGLDWSTDPIECKVDPNDLANRLRHEGMEAFLQRIRLNTSVWTLEDADGPALLVATHQPNRLMLACWASRAEAEKRLERAWSGMIAVEIPLHNFVEATLPWLIEQNWLVAPGYSPGGDVVEVSPLDLVRRLEPESFAKSA
ncbi:MAG TPA: DUF2750 domain-containing protein [Hyphomicrobiaceae bacterium]|nr:DUF2750 domain-containing protein [Hyphomicrobiaceae bacterium]